MTQKQWKEAVRAIFYVEVTVDDYIPPDKDAFEP